MDNWFHPTLFWACNYLSMLVLKLNNVSKMGHTSPRGQCVQTVSSHILYCPWSRFNTARFCTQRDDDKIRWNFEHTKSTPYLALTGKRHMGCFSRIPGATWPLDIESNIVFTVVSVVISAIVIISVFSCIMNAICLATNYVAVTCDGGTASSQITQAFHQTVSYIYIYIESESVTH